MDAFDGRRCDDQIPRGFENPARPQSLPEGDIKFPVRGAAADQPGHDERFAHCFTILAILGLLILALA